MQIQTLDDHDFGNACAELYGLLMTGHPDGLIGIRTGGAVVLERMVRDSASRLPTFTADARRASTARKEGLRLGRVLRRLPLALTNRLRVMEHLYREYQFQQRGIEPRRATLSTELISWLGQQPRHVVVVDDAVDTGSSLLAVQAALLAVAPETRIETAAIVQTFSMPVIRPTYVLHRSLLFRFPWSMDART